MTSAAEAVEGKKRPKEKRKVGPVVFLIAFEVRLFHFKGFKLHYPKKLVIIYMLFQQW